jgi:uncharacterized protein YecE (DUF72 family)
MAEIPSHDALADREKQRGNRRAKPDIAPLNRNVWDRRIPLSKSNRRFLLLAPTDSNYLQDQSWMPYPKDLGSYDLTTADFSYIRWLGNRKDIEKVTTTRNSTIIDRTADLQTWVDVCEKIQKRGITQYVYANNHYSGFAPATVELFRSLCKVRGIETPLNVQLPAQTEPMLFDISPN